MIDESLFAEPLCDGYVLTAFRCDTVCFEERLKRLSSEATLRSPTTFFSGRSENFTDAMTLRARFLRRLSALIQVEEGLTLTNIVDLTVATRHNFSGFRLHFQPQVNEAGYCGGEFLVRVSSKWEKNPVRPDLFIPILEKKTVDSTLRSMGCRSLHGPSETADIEIQNRFHREFQYERLSGRRHRFRAFRQPKPDPFQDPCRPRHARADGNGPTL